MTAEALFERTPEDNIFYGYFDEIVKDDSITDIQFALMAQEAVLAEIDAAWTAIDTHFTPASSHEEFYHSALMMGIINDLCELYLEDEDFSLKFSSGYAKAYMEEIMFFDVAEVGYEIEPGAAQTLHYIIYCFLQEKLAHYAIEFGIEYGCFSPSKENPDEIFLDSTLDIPSDSDRAIILERAVEMGTQEVH